MRSIKNSKYYWKGNVHQRKQHRSSLQLWQTAPKSVRLLVIAIVTLCTFAGIQRGRNNLDQVKKSYPTNFSRIHDFSNIHLWSPEHPVRYNNGTHIDDIYAYVDHLGTGQEGSVSIYKDIEEHHVAVKTFSLKARNEIPAEIAGNFIEFTTTWPSEIEAGLLLSSLSNASFVPVLDYFILQESAGWSWALVSPLILGGTLLSLAEKERVAYNPSTFAALDQIYRPSLDSLLLALEDLHLAGICHDDIKPDNIFIGDDRSHWMLGDLGNVREVKHPWHATASWKRQNQLADCKTNDVKRALKTYLAFLRTASVDSDAFDQQFWLGKTAWSRMYWDFNVYPIDAGRLAKLSERLYGRKNGEILDDIAEDAEFDDSLRQATERELTCTTLPRQLWIL